VQVLDDGPGLREDELPELFRLYVRGADAPRRASGAGIGLYVCARLVRAMGGRVWARNRPEGGAEFGFALPLSPVTPL
jgi:signal transduction histidine kinase